MINAPSARVAVIDIGSNSIKALVAQRGADGGLEEVDSRAIDARIGAGISRERPQLSEEGMTRGLDAVRQLAAGAAGCGADQLIIVATSAVRDAANGADFRERVRAATGVDLRILTGDEEAALIGRGLLSDPAMRERSDFTVCDLGGGSLECVAFEGRRVRAQVSLPLGCVRLTERFIPDPSASVPPDALAAVSAHVHTALGASGFTFHPPAAPELVGTGGTFSTARRIIGRREGLRFDASSPVLSLATLRGLLAEVSALPLARRGEIPGLALARADVFPAALATVIAVLEYAGAGAFRHSMRNLRHGLASEALAILTR